MHALVLTAQRRNTPVQADLQAEAREISASRDALRARAAFA
jgi:hypothetical protein